MLRDPGWRCVRRCAQPEPEHISPQSGGRAEPLRKVRDQRDRFEKEMMGLVGRLKYRSGRPFSRSRPVLETDIPDTGVRATALCRP